MKKLLLFTLLTTSFFTYSQKDSKTLVTINGNPITVGEFKRVYEKNLDQIEGDNDVNSNLDLYVNYKLKVKQAYQLKLDTLRSYKREIETYKNQLSAPYLQDKEFLKNLIKETYNRTKNELKASHILIRIPRGTQPKDTLAFYNKIMDARKRILNGEDFAKVAAEVSEDPSAKRNGGDLGYFSAFKMVFPFEDAAYKTKIGKVSMPFKTRFGYHIVQPVATRLSKGDLQVAHILITDTTAVGKSKIETVYQKLKKGEKFEDLAKQFSNDTGSKNKGGRLQKFGSGRMVKPFEDTAFSLQNIGDFKIVKTRFGYHIIKLLNKYPIESFEKMEKEIASKVKGSGRSRLSDNAVLNKLKKKYSIVVHQKARDKFNEKNVRATPKDSLQNDLLSINDKNIKQVDFFEYIRNRRHKSIPILFEMFKDEQILKYFKENLVHTEPEYANTLQEYKDGLLLFELMQQKIWNKSSKDSLGLKNFFTKNAAKYSFKKLDDGKGQVMNDYQNYLEKEWIADLRKNAKIKVNKRVLKKLNKHYRKDD